MPAGPNQIGPVIPVRTIWLWIQANGSSSVITAPVLQELQTTGLRDALVEHDPADMLVFKILYIVQTAAGLYVGDRLDIKYKGTHA